MRMFENQKIHDTRVLYIAKKIDWKMYQVYHINSLTQSKPWLSVRHKKNVYRYSSVISLLSNSSYLSALNSYPKTGLYG